MGDLGMWAGAALLAVLAATGGFLLGRSDVIPRRAADGTGYAFVSYRRKE